MALYEDDRGLLIPLGIAIKIVIKVLARHEQVEFHSIIKGLDSEKNSWSKHRPVRRRK
jgi:hypothetical protein